MEFIIIISASEIGFAFAVGNDNAFELGFIIDFSIAESNFYSCWMASIIISFNNSGV